MLNLVECRNHTIIQDKFSYNKGKYSDIINQKETDPRKVEIKA